MQHTGDLLINETVGGFQNNIAYATSRCVNQSVKLDNMYTETSVAGQEDDDYYDIL